MKHDERVKVVGHARLAEGVFSLAFSAPSIAAAARPGQFVELRPVAGQVQFLRIPLAVWRADAAAGTVEVCFQVVGEGTARLAQMEPGESADVAGPLGNGWQLDEGAPASGSRALLVCGGMGAVPQTMLAHELACAGYAVDVVMGAATSKLLVCRDVIAPAVEASGGVLHITTDDGSEGIHGFVTEKSDALIASGDYAKVFVCGPHPMMRNVVKPALAHGVAAQVSMERLMACGVGACLSCVLQTVDGLRRVCADGPVFAAEEVVW